VFCVSFASLRRLYPSQVRTLFIPPPVTLLIASHSAVSILYICGPCTSHIFACDGMRARTFTVCLRTDKQTRKAADLWMIRHVRRIHRKFGNFVKIKHIDHCAVTLGGGSFHGDKAGA